MEAKAFQYTLEGGIMVATGHRVRDQLVAIMEAEPDTREDEDLLTARWLQLYRACGNLCVQELRHITRAVRKADIRRRRQELRHLFPYSDEEEE